MRQITKKGMSLGDMYPAVLTLVLVGLVLGAGLYVLAEFREGVASQYSGSQDGINVTAGTTTLTDAALTSFKIVDDTTPTLVNTTGTAYTNFTFDQTTGVFTWGSDIVAKAETDLFNVSYTYIYDAADSTEASMTSVVTGLDDFATWIGIIVVVIAAAIVLSVVLSSFGRRRAII